MPAAVPLQDRLFAIRLLTHVDDPNQKADGQEDHRQDQERNEGILKIVPGSFPDVELRRREARGNGEPVRKSTAATSHVGPSPPSPPNRVRVAFAPKHGVQEGDSAAVVGQGWQEAVGDQRHQRNLGEFLARERCRRAHHHRRVSGRGTPKHKIRANNTRCRGPPSRPPLRLRAHKEVGKERGIEARWWHIPAPFPGAQRRERERSTARNIRDLRCGRCQSLAQGRVLCIGAHKLRGIDVQEREAKPRPKVLLLCTKTSHPKPPKAKSEKKDSTEATEKATKAKLALYRLEGR